MGVGQEGPASAATSAQGSGAAAKHGAGPGPDELAGREALGPAASPAAEAVGGRSRQALDLEFEFATEVIYHRSREAWLMRMHRIMLFGTILAGTVAATDVVGAKLAAIVAAACGALDLVADYVTAATDHRDIARDYLKAAGALIRDDFSPTACAAAQDERFRISAVEPPLYRAAYQMAYNQAVDALGRDPAEKVAVPSVRRWLAHLRRFDD